MTQRVIILLDQLLAMVCAQYSCASEAEVFRALQGEMENMNRVEAIHSEVGGDPVGVRYLHYMKMGALCKRLLELRDE